MNEKFWEEKNILVTGANGLVGSHIVKKLSLTTAKIIALIRSKDPKAYFYSQGLDEKTTIVYGDLKDFNKMCNVIARYEIEYVLHLGAQPIVTTAFFNPLETFRTNINGTINILEATRKLSTIKAVIIASSDKAYGKKEKLPYTEDMALKGESPYEVSKSCADLISLSYAKTYGLPVAVTRFGNIYGPGDLNFNRIVPGTIKAGIRDTVLDIRSNGKTIREYLYVEDVVNGYLALIENIEKTKGEAFNFGSGERFTVLEVVKKIGKIMNKKIKTRILNSAQNEIPEQYLCAQKVKDRIGWNAEFKFEKGLEKTIPWYEKFLKVE